VRRVKRKAAAAAVVGLALLAAPANASTELQQPCPYEHTQDGAQLLVMGCYIAGTDTIYYDTGETLWHERGHAFDHQRLTDEDRVWISRTFFRGRLWSTPIRSDGAEERFAEFFAFCHIRAPRARRDGRRAQIAIGYGLIPYTARHRRFCNTVAVLELVR
jgi:hypothetical protein